MFARAYSLWLSMVGPSHLGLVSNLVAARQLQRRLTMLVSPSFTIFPLLRRIYTMDVNHRDAVDNLHRTIRAGNMPSTAVLLELASHVHPEVILCIFDRLNLPTVQHLADTPSVLQPLLTTYRFSVCLTILQKYSYIRDVYPPGYYNGTSRSLRTSSTLEPYLLIIYKTALLAEATVQYLTTTLWPEAGSEVAPEGLQDAVVVIMRLSYEMNNSFRLWDRTIAVLPKQRRARVLRCLLSIAQAVLQRCALTSIATLPPPFRHELSASGLLAYIIMPRLLSPLESVILDIRVSLELHGDIRRVLMRGYCGITNPYFLASLQRMLRSTAWSLPRQELNFYACGLKFRFDGQGTIYLHSKGARGDEWSSNHVLVQLMDVLHLGDAFDERIYTLQYFEEIARRGMPLIYCNVGRIEAG